MALIKMSVILDRYLAAYISALGAEAAVAEKDFAALAELCALPDFRNIASNPMLKPMQLIGLLNKLFSVLSLHKMTQNLLLVLAENGRFSELPKFAVAFPRFYAQHRNIPLVEVTTMSHLPDADREKLIAALKNFYQSEIFIEFETDARLLGGMVVKVGSDMVDTSLRSKLDRMKSSMKGIG